MFKWLNKPLGKGKQKAKQLLTTESKDLTELDNASQQAPSDALRSLLKRATADAEQIVTSIKERAQIEAEAEAVRIIAQAKLEVREIKDRAEIAAKKQAEDILAAAEEKTEITEVEEPVQLQGEAAEVERGAAEELVEEHLPEEKHGREKQEVVPVKPDSKALYSGEVELVIPMPVELKLVSKLYNYLQTIPELKILHTRGSWDQGTNITVVLEKPMPLISFISKTPGVEVTPGQLEKDDVTIGKSSLLLRGGEKKVRGRIKLVLKEA